MPIRPEGLQGFAGSRSVRRRLECRYHRDYMVWDCVRGLNALYSGEKLEAAAIKFGEVSATQRAALEHIFNSVQELGPPPVGLDGPGALQQLRAFDGYGEDQVPAAVKSYDSSLLSLPAGDDQPVSLASLLGEDGGKIVDDFVATRLLNQDEARRRLSQAGVVRCYSDPKLLEPRTYSKFVARLFDSGLIEMSLEEPTEKVEIFFVGKKDGRLRMVVDCRRSNQWFCPPDKVSLATADVLSRIDLSDKVGDLHVATADLKDAFYHFMLPLALRQYFGLRSLTAGELGINKVGDIEVGVNTRIHPRLRVLPMGWSHALWWCQTVHQKIVGEVGAGIDTCLQDKAAVPKGDCMHLEYVDNFVCLGTSKDQVHGLSAAGVQALRDKGLVVHEEETGHGDIKVLGWQFKGSHLRPLPHRIWRLIFAMRQLLKIGRCSGKQLERVIGHATFVGLGRREVLSIFGETYTYIHSHYYHAHRLWPSVRRELALWISLCPLLWRDLAAPWASEVTAVDASTWGLGAVVADFTPNEVRELGRFSERWRFELPQFSRPRAAALGSSMIEDDGDAAGCKWALATQHEAEARLPPMQVVEEKPLKELFEPVRKQTVDRSWKVVGRFKWRRQEGMPVLEGRASLYGIKHALRKVDAFHKRHLILSDSTAAICALDRGSTQLINRREGLCFLVGLVTLMVIRFLVALAALMVIHKQVPLPEPRKVLHQAKAKGVAPRRGSAASTSQAVNKEAVKKARAAERKKLRAEHVTLADASVSPACRDRYSVLWRTLCAEAQLDPQGIYTGSDVDLPMSQMLEDMFDSGEDLSQGEYLVAAVQFKQPHLRGTKQSLPLSRQSLAGWRKLDPPKSRLPLPWEVVCLMALEAFSQKKVEIGLYLLLAFVAYLRPGEVSRLRVCDLVAPVGTVKTWSLVLHPFEIGVPSKTAEFDETILFDIKPIQFLPSILHRRLRLGIRTKGELMFSTTVDEVRKFMNSVSDRFGMGAAVGDPHPYRLRHGGPSRDVLMKHRTLQEVQKRGRWKSFNSVRRYEKGGRVTQQLQALPKPALDKAIAAAGSIEKVASGLKSQQQIILANGNLWLRFSDLADSPYVGLAKTPSGHEGEPVCAVDGQGGPLEIGPDPEVVRQALSDLAETRERIRQLREASAQHPEAREATGSDLKSAIAGAKELQFLQPLTGTFDPSTFTRTTGQAQAATRSEGSALFAAEGPPAQGEGGPADREESESLQEKTPEVKGKAGDGDSKKRKMATSGEKTSKAVRRAADKKPVPAAQSGPGLKSFFRCVETAEAGA
ncbi:Gag-Pro-Pol polyprotein [Symbiodinium microadriaticum]|uniref:Gag-Pro-Pol polyprotein n=1 Tax=Symbiodinium microadriaticum TaxID=2951 RepID=A0A1Q9CT66_SYMMI|nr:Gag-Pro-Pol polyprotein [Symbiodinium microadriaticum]